jgi:hypothetical protein
MLVSIAESVYSINKFSSNFPNPIEHILNGRILFTEPKDVRPLCPTAPVAIGSLERSLRVVGSSLDEI